MDRKRYSPKWIVLISALLVLASAGACAGADGDPAPVPPEAGPVSPACDDAGAAG